MIDLGIDLTTKLDIVIPIWHTGIFGMSGVGKTKLLKYMLSQAKKDEYRVLIFDSKVTGAEFEGIGEEIPFYLKQSTDPDVLISLLESSTERRGNYQWARGGFIKISEDSKTFEDVGDNLAAKLKDKNVKGRTHDMYYEIKHDWDKLMELIEKFEFEFPPKLTTDNWIFRMPTWKLPNIALQGLVVGSTVDWLMRSPWKKFILLFDEAPNFVHQKYYNPAKRTIQILDSQGRSKELFGWYSGQNITGFDKSNMKNLNYWALGRQKEKNEANDTYNTISHKIVTRDEVKTLPIRTFLIETPEDTFKIEVPFVDETQLFGNGGPPPPPHYETETVYENYDEEIARLEKLEGIVSKW